jgi:hypothetical protein
MNDTSATEINLPAPPAPYFDWRATFAAVHRMEPPAGSDVPLHQQHIQFIVTPGRQLSRLNDAIVSYPYWQIAQYAALEQVRQDQLSPPLLAKEWGDLLNAFMDTRRSFDNGIASWLRVQLRRAEKVDRLRDKLRY